MRDEKIDAPYKPDVVSPFYAERLAEAQQQVEMLKTISLEDARVMCNKERFECHDRAVERIAEMNVVKARYEQMARKVEDWIAPTGEHKSLKTFMLDQLSMCASDHDTSYYEEDAKVPTKCTDDEARAFAANKLGKALKDVSYYAGQSAKEFARVTQRNEWVVQLQESLKSYGE
jgi:hypothetical protein